MGLFFEDERAYKLQIAQRMLKKNMIKDKKLKEKVKALKRERIDLRKLITELS